MSGRGKGVRSRRNRVSPYANIAISDRQWDLNNPSNWTIQKFREELDKKRHKDTKFFTQISVKTIIYRKF